MTRQPKPAREARFSWYRDDLESKFGFRGARFTHVSAALSLFVAALLTAAFYGALAPFPKAPFAELFTRRGPFQYVAVLISFWALVTVIVKWFKIRLQRKALTFADLVPVEADFVLAPATVGQVLARLRQACDDPERFLLFRRIELALSNLKNMGRVSDLDGVLESLASNDEDVMESSYTLLKGLIWMIPVLGFVGTVQGLSQAIGEFGGVLGVAKDIQELVPVLRGVTGGLSTAFDTTFVALVAALTIHLVLIVVRKSEEEMMAACKTYCQRHIVGRLRLTDFERIG